jgi:hypothetical protein
MAAVLKLNHDKLAKADVAACLANLKAAIDGWTDDVHMCLTALESIHADDMFVETTDHVTLLETAVTDLGTRHSEVKAVTDDLKLEV